MTDSPSRRVQFLLRIEEDLLNKIREEAALYDVSVSEMMRRIMHGHTFTADRAKRRSERKRQWWMK
jgi:hypothetical protein